MVQVKNLLCYAGAVGLTPLCWCYSVGSHFAAPWTVACQAPPAMRFPRQEYWSGLPFPSPEDLPNPGIKSGSPALQTDYLPSEPPRESQGTKIPHVTEQLSLHATAREFN